MKLRVSAVALFFIVSVFGSHAIASPKSPKVSALTNKSLLAELKEERFDAATKMIKTGVDLLGHDEEGLTALHIAAEQGCVPVVELLLERKVPIDIPTVKMEDDMGLQSASQTPLMRAAAAGKVEMIRLLRKRQAKLDGVDGYGWTPLFHAVIGGNLEAVSALIRLGADVNHPDEGKSTPFFFAVQTCHVDIAQALLAAGAKLETKNAKGRDASFWVFPQSEEIYCTDASMIKLMLEKGLLSANATNPHSRNSYLCELLDEDNYEAAEELRKHGAKIKTSRMQGQSCLSYLVGKGQFEGVEWLVQNGDDPNGKSLDGSPILHAAVSVESYGNSLEKLLSVLFKKGADAKRKNKSGVTAFEALLVERRTVAPEVVELFLGAGIPANMMDSRGEPFLNLAIERGHLEAASVLLKHGANPNVRGKHGAALHAFGHNENALSDADFLNLLLKKGADVNALDENGEGAFMLFLKNTRSYTITSPFSVYLGHGGKIPARITAGVDMLEIARRKSAELASMVEILLEGNQSGCCKYQDVARALMKRGVILYDVGDAKSGIGALVVDGSGPKISGSSFVAADFWEKGETAVVVNLAWLPSVPASSLSSVFGLYVVGDQATVKTQKIWLDKVMQDLTVKLSKKNFGPIAKNCVGGVCLEIRPSSADLNTSENSEMLKIEFRVLAKVQGK